MLQSRMFLGNPNNFPISLQPIRRNHRAAALKNFDLIGGQNQQERRSATRNYLQRRAAKSFRMRTCAKMGRGAYFGFGHTKSKSPALAASSRLRGGLMLAPAVGHDNHANIFGLPNDSENQVGKKQPAQQALLLGPAHQYLRDQIAVREIDDGLGRVAALQSPALDVKIPGEIHMLLYALKVLRYRAAASEVRRYTDSEAIRAQVIRHSAAPPYQHGRRGIGGDIYQNPIADLLVGRGRKCREPLWRLRHLGDIPAFHLVRSLPQGKFAQGCQG